MSDFDINKSTNNQFSTIKWIEIISNNFVNCFSNILERNRVIDTFFKRNDQIELRSKIKNNYMRGEMKEFIRPIVNIVYNEIYIYIWLICFYNVFLIFLVLANLFLIIRILNKPRY